MLLCLRIMRNYWTMYVYFHSQLELYHSPENTEGISSPRIPKDIFFHFPPVLVLSAEVLKYSSLRFLPNPKTMEDHLNPATFENLNLSFQEPCLGYIQ